MAILLIETGTDVYARDRDGMTLLHCLGGSNDTHIVRMLLARDADPNTECGSGETRLDVARQSKSTKVVELLELLQEEPVSTRP